MADSSEGRWDETSAPVFLDWEPGAGAANRPSFDATTPGSEAGGPWDELSFRLATPADAPRADPSIAMTRSHSPSRPAKARKLVFPAPGTIVGGFRLVSELGRGAFARVYLAEQTDLAGRPVALKVAGALGDEPQALARLQHANIVPIFSIHDDPATGLRLLCMPYFGGANLAQVLQRAGAPLAAQAGGRSLVEALDVVGGRSFVDPSLTRAEADPDDPAGEIEPVSALTSRSLLGRSLARLPWWKSVTSTESDPAPPADDRDQPARRFLRSHSYVQAAAWITARLAEGLEHAHARGILHRDLKPSNILIAADGTPMLLDFNLSVDSGKPLPEEEARALLGGTLPYMAPEHLDAFNPTGSTEAAAVDARSDLYALGLILYEILAGHQAFADPPPGLPLVEVVSRMTEERRRGAPDVRSANPDVPPSLAAIVAKCLDPDPSRRHARAADLAEDLQRFLDDRPNAHAPEPSLRERCAKWWRRHPEARGAGPVAAVALAGLTAVAVAFWSIADYAGAAKATLLRAHFRERFQRCQLLLNTSSGPTSHLPAGMAEAEALLGAYGVFRAGDWTASPLVGRLPPEERKALREEVSELLLLLARARVSQAGRASSEAGRRAALIAAVAMLDRAEGIDPSPSAALFEARAQFLAAQGEADRARGDRERAERTPPASARDFYLRGTSRAAQGQTDLAVQDLERAVTRDPRRFWAWFVLGLCRHDRGQFSLAAGDFGTCTVLAPDFAWPHLNRGLCLAAAGQLTAARAAYDRALEISPDFMEALIDRALACLELDDPAAAERDLAHAIRLGNRDAAVLAARAEALARTGRRDRAEADFAEALKARPDDPRIRVARGMSRLATDPRGAREDFARVLARDPRDARAHYGMSLLLRSDNPDSALEHARTALDIAPDFQDALRLRAVMLGRRGDPGAAADADRLVRAPTAQNLYNAACALALLDSATRTSLHRDRARALLQRALDLGFPAAHAEADPDLKGIR